MPYLPIEDCGIIGNLCTAALVGTNGSIDQAGGGVIVRQALIDSVSQADGLGNVGQPVLRLRGH